MDDDLMGAVEAYAGTSREFLDVISIDYGSEDDSESTDASSTTDTDTDGEHEQAVVVKGRKRKADKTKWLRNIRKKRKAAGLKHKMHKNNENEPTRYRMRKQRREYFCRCNPRCCDKFTEEEKDWVFEAFYDLRKHVLQNMTLRCLIEVEGVKELANGTTRKIFKYRIHLCGRSEVVCKNYFLAIHDITAGRLEKKVLKKEVSIHDGRGKHGKQKATQADKIETVKNFINSIPARQSHYSLKDNPNARYLDSTWNCSRLYLEYVRRHKHDRHGIVKPQKFRHIFNYDFNLRFGYPRSDKCKTCEDYLIAIRNEQRNRRPDTAEIERINTELTQHHRAAQIFYDSIRSSKDSDNTVFSFCMDFGSNLALPVTNVNEEFYKRQLWIHNLAFHDLKSGQAVMFIYSEHFADKGPDEVISALKYYIETFIPQEVTTVQIYADNASAHNKNATLYSAYQFLANSRFESIRVRYAEVGHSRMAADSDFGKIVLRKRRYETIYGPSQWVQIIEASNIKNPFKVVFLEKPCTDNMAPNGKHVVKVLDYRGALLPKVNAKLTGISKIKCISFTPMQNPTILDHENKEKIGSLFPLLRDASNPDLRQAFLRAKIKFHKYKDIAPAKLTNLKELLVHTVLQGRERFYDTIPKMKEPKTRGRENDPEQTNSN